MSEKNNHLKEQFREYYTFAEATLARKVTDLPQDSKEFFEEIEKHRYSLYPYFKNLMEFDQYKGKNVLEIGVGEGTDHAQFAKNGAVLCGIDLTPRHIDMTKRRFKAYSLSSDLRVADAEQLPFADNSFDLVYSCGVLFLTPHIEKAVSEIYRVLKPGGKIIALFYNKNSFHYYINIILYNGIVRGELQYLTFDKLLDWYAGDGFGYPHVRYLTKTELKNLFRSYENLKFYISNLDKDQLPFLSRFFSGRMLAFFSQYFGYYLTIKAFKSKV